MREYMIRHKTVAPIWSSITIDANDTHALVCAQGEHISTLPTDSAYMLLDYLRQSGDYVVEEILGGY